MFAAAWAISANASVASARGQDSSPPAEAAEAMLEKLTGAKTPRAAVAAAVKSQG